MSFSIYVDKDKTICVILFDDNGKPLRKIWIDSDGRISFRDFNTSAREDIRYVLLKPLQRRGDQSGGCKI